MKIYAHHGITDFVICCGYKGYVIKEFFANYFLHTSDVTIDIAGNRMEVHHRTAEPWRVTLIDTGELTQTGGRIRRVRDYVDGTFCLTYGDGLADVAVDALIAFHRAEGRMVTVTAIQPAGRFGALDLDGSRVRRFTEKPQGDGRWISGGFFVCEPGVFDLIEGDHTVWERDTLEGLAAAGDVSAWRHGGFWAAMDTLRDKVQLEQLWAEGRAPWRIWA
jgi:glucose-1-phosphate cytidylyltransferase